MTWHWAPVSILNVTFVLFMSRVTDQSDLESLIAKRVDAEVLASWLDVDVVTP